MRGHLEITQGELSSRLEALGRPIPTASIGRLESGDRRVDVDDLMALAVALEVSPVALLLPFTDSPGTEVDASFGRKHMAIVLWQWATGAAPLRGPGHMTDENFVAFRERSHPWWLKVDASLDEAAEYRRDALGVAIGGGPLYVEGNADGEHQAEA